MTQGRIYSAVRRCRHCGKSFTGCASTKRQAAVDARQSMALHISRMHVR